MRLSVNMTLHDDGAFAYHAHCGDCTFISTAHDEHDQAYLTGLRHACVTSRPA